MSIIKIGQKAPNFELPSSLGRPIALSNYKGKKNVLVAFYCFAFSPTCSLEFVDFNKDYKKFKDLDTEILGISIDQIFATKAFSKYVGEKHPLLSDPTGKVPKMYGVYDPKGAFSKRAYYIVDKKGIVRFKFVVKDPRKKLTNDKLLAVLKKLEKR